MLAHIALLAAAFLWGTSFIAGKLAMEMADASVIVLLRFLLASLVWLPLCIRASKVLQGFRQWLHLFGLAFLMIPATFVLQFIGLQLTSASSAAVMIGFEPLMVLLVGWCIWKERPSRLQCLLSVLALLGVLMVMGWSEGADWRGCVWVLLSTVVVAFWVRVSRVWMRTLSVNVFTALTTVAGALCLFPVTWVTAKSWSIHWTWPGAMALLYLGVGCSLLAGWLWNKGLQSTPAHVSALFLALEPVFGVLLAALLLEERLGPLAVLGTCCVLCPVLFAAWRTWRDARLDVSGHPA